MTGSVEAQVLANPAPLLTLSSLGASTDISDFRFGDQAIQIFRDQTRRAR
jgi:hypothetical protein